MRLSRLAWRGARLSVVTLVSFLALIVGYAGVMVTGGGRRGRRRWRRSVKRRWARGVCRALRVRVEVVGRPPDHPCFLVANHLGYLDIPVLAGVVDTVFVSKAEVASWPVIGWLASSAGTLYVDRDRKRSLPEVNRRIREALAEGDGVVVFPEGTSTGGAEVLPFRPSLLAPAADLGLEVRCASLSYATEPGDPPASESVAWWRDMPFGPHVLGLLQLSGVRARVVFSPRVEQDPDRKALSRKLWRSVSLGIPPQA